VGAVTGIERPVSLFCVVSTVGLIDVNMGTNAFVACGGKVAVKGETVDVGETGICEATLVGLFPAVGLTIGGET
jgi:hypothetical protein